jgi:hypothetical protein
MELQDEDLTRRLLHVHSSRVARESPLRELPVVLDSEQPPSTELALDDNCSYTSQWDDEESEPIEMHAGTYYVGDMYFVLSPSANCELGRLQSTHRGTRCVEGQDGWSTISRLYAESPEGLFKLRSGREVVSFRQNGTQFQNDDNFEIEACPSKFFQLQSDSIGMTLLDGLEKNWVDPQCVFVANSFNKKNRTSIYTKTNMMDYINEVGTIVTYDKDFVCSKCISRNVETDTQTETIYFGEKLEILFVQAKLTRSWNELSF